MPVDALFCCGSSMNNMVNWKDEHMSDFLSLYPDMTDFTSVYNMDGIFIYFNWLQYFFTLINWNISLL